LEYYRNYAVCENQPLQPTGARLKVQGSVQKKIVFLKTLRPVPYATLLIKYPSNANFIPDIKSHWLIELNGSF
jgi:hypothetical protein